MNLPYQPGDICKVLDELEAIELNKCDSDEYSPVFIQKGEIITVLWYKQDTVGWTSGGFAKESVYHTFHFLWDNQIWYMDFGGNHNKLEKLECPVK